MSSCEIYAVKTDGNIEFCDEAKNAWGGAMHIWGTLSKKYNVPCTILNYDPLWKMCGGDVMVEVDQIVMASTFDRVVIKKDFMPKLIDSMEKFIELYPTETLLKEAAILKEMLEDAEVIGVCFNQTSVNSLLLSGGYDDEKDEEVPYNIFTMNEHWFLSSQDGKAIELQGE